MEYFKGIEKIKMLLNWVYKKRLKFILKFAVTNKVENNNRQQAICANRYGQFYQIYITGNLAKIGDSHP